MYWNLWRTFSMFGAVVFPFYFVMCWIEVFFVTFVLRYWWVLQVFSPGMSHIFYGVSASFEVTTVKGWTSRKTRIIYILRRQVNSGTQTNKKILECWRNKWNNSSLCLDFEYIQCKIVMNNGLLLKRHKYITTKLLTVKRYCKVELHMNAKYVDDLAHKNWPKSPKFHRAKCSNQYHMHIKHLLK